MADQFKQRLAMFSAANAGSGLNGGLRGIEREGLRVDAQARLAMTTHPERLGSALTHSQITTDYSESLLELITPPSVSIETLMSSLENIHRATHQALNGELLWSHSMPCPLPDEADIPIAQYGKSHLGKLKYVYRNGLALRYGKPMQCIAGIHYNFSVSEHSWQLLRQSEGSALSPAEYRSEQYMATIRNFHRYSWLLMVLFGASPALADSFVRNRPSGLDRLSSDTLYLPHATSLRMSDLGYQSTAQSGISVSTNSLDCYIADLHDAITNPYAAYRELGVRHEGEWTQINANVLQIENEYYSTIRPKQVCRRGERPIQALKERGVQYLEVRCLDIDPFSPVGIAPETARFIDAFLYFCLLSDSPLNTPSEKQENSANFAAAVRQGRLPGLHLQRRGQPVDLRVWAEELLGRIASVANLLDAETGASDFADAVAKQAAKLKSPALLPSSCVLKGIKECGGSFVAFAMRQSQRHAAFFFGNPLSGEKQAVFDELARMSRLEQEQIEASDTGTFDDYISHFNQQMDSAFIPAATSRNRSECKDGARTGACRPCLS